MNDKIKLKDACKILNGFAFKSGKYVDSGIRIIRIANVQKGYVEDERPAFYPNSEESSIRDYMLEEDDLLLSLTGNVGRVALLDKRWLPAALNQRVACLRIKDDRIIKDYLYFALLSDKFENDCTESSKGIAQKNMSTEWLKDYEIPLPSRQKQREIISSLKQLSMIIKNKTEQIQQLDDLIKARFVEMFGDVYKSSKYSRKKWSDIVDIKNGKDYKKVAVKDGGFPVYGTGGEMARASEYLCPENTIIVGRKGTINNPLLVREKFWNVDTAFGVIPGKELHHLYFFWFCRMFDFSRLNKQAVLPSTTKADLLNIEMQVPPIEIQNQFAIFIAQVDKSKFVLSNELTMCDFYIRLIHDRVMHGRINLRVTQ